MVIQHFLYTAIVSALLAAQLAFAAPPVVEMGEALVTEAPMAKTIGGATFATQKTQKAMAPTLIALGTPTFEDTSALESRRIEQIKRGQPFEIGFARNVPNGKIALSQLGWETLGDGSIATRFDIASDTAAAMRIGLALKSSGSGNPDAVTLRFGGNDGRVFEQNGREFAGKHIGWSPSLMGDRATVEIVLAKGQRPQDFNLTLPQISHFDISPIASEAEISKITARIGESDECHKDIVCRTNPTTGFLNAEKAVARMTYVKDGTAYTCTGALLNNNHSPKKRLFWSAAHCISSQAVADTLETYWFYKATTCGGLTQAPGAVTLTGGAFLRHVNNQRDTLLLELKTAPPTGAVYAAWNSNVINTTGISVEGIHHPNYDVKMYALGSVTNKALVYKPFKSVFYEVAWNTGVTARGSSGSPLFTVDSQGLYQFRGGLKGGESSCDTPTAPDVYSRFSDVYKSISSYFNP